jgi:hypothetical protein
MVRLLAFAAALALVASPALAHGKQGGGRSKAGHSHAGGQKAGGKHKG